MLPCVCVLCCVCVCVVCVCVYHNFFIHLSTDRHLGCFRILAVVSNEHESAGNFSKC